ncbi:polyphenol oxidase I, chloroplastic-like [Olea europaea var. sylvestris]|uniref:polyphenol oxidase I, chloroplastic-like n=1 Tax=Olea europaea var. sylvestris TaxID=158386 RepID=UPI000C1CFC14|nr:polyphenol oxidase I, chloroplastic-like [Olea europaea var. sylvestris]
MLYIERTRTSIMHLIEIAMATSQTSCTILNPTPYSHKYSSKPFFAKPSYFFTNAKRSIDFQLSCKGGEKRALETSLRNKIDRRNVLFGFGGLYSAANLDSDLQLALADPLKAPEFSKCGVAKDLNKGGAAVDVNCCPPLFDKIIDYKLPHATKLRVRPAAHKARKEYIAKYKKAIELMKALPPEDPRSFTQQANIHCAYCNGAHDQAGHPGLDIQVHNSWLFFPFHRWYLYFFERILGKLIGDPTFALPYWNWDNPKGMTVPSMFIDSTSPLYNAKRNLANMPPTVIDLGLTGTTDDLQKVVNNLTIMYSEMVRSVNTVEDFMGKPYLDGSTTDPGPGSSERGSHATAHVFVGDPKQPSFEDMGNFYSAGRDPLFYCHHSNVDRMWTLWRDLKTPIPKDITEADFLNAEFLFYDENAQLVRVRVGDSVNNANMGYTYEKMELPWLNYKPPKKAAKSKVKNLSTAPNAAHVFPVTLNNIVRVEVPKSSKGKADELLVLEDIEVDPSKYIKFDVFVNDEDDESKELDKAEYAGTFAQVPHKTKNSKGKSSINLKLTQLYDDIDVADDDTIVVTIVPRSNGDNITIGGIKIIPAPIATFS